MRADNSAHIIAAARRRSDDARRRAVTALRRLDADGQPVTFSTVASAAGVLPLLALCPGRPAGADRAAPHPAAARPVITTGPRTGSGRHPPRCCDAWKQPPSASASWNQRTTSSATHSSAHSENRGQRRSAHQPRHARKAESRNIPAGLWGNRGKVREQHCPRHKATGQTTSRSSG